MQTKVSEIVGLIERRVEDGTYTAETLPSQRALAAQLRVSPVTAHRALAEIRGRWADSKAPVEPTKSNVLMLAPAFHSSTYASWRWLLGQIVEERGGRVRSVGYVGWSDPVITEVLDEPWDAVFMVPPPMPKLPGILVDRFRKERHRLVTLFDDYTELGVPCVDMASQLFIPKIVQHLVDLGHRRIGCINTSPNGPVIERRMQAFTVACSEHGICGPLHNTPVQSGQHTDDAGRVFAADLIKSGQFDCTAYFCTTRHTAVGVMRAMHDHGLVVGKDVSLCTCDNYRECQLEVPSLTTLSDPDAGPLLRQALERVLDKRGTDDGNLFIHPDDIDLAAGESTGPARA